MSKVKCRLNSTDVDFVVRLNLIRKSKSQKGIVPVIANSEQDARGC